MPISALRTRLASELLEFAWDEWAQMGVFAAPQSTHHWAQDPEALLLLTLEVGRNDPRLFDEVLDWWLHNEPLISLRRLRTLCDGPEDERLSAAAMEWVRQQRRPQSSPRPHERNAEVEPLFPGANLPGLRTDPVFSAFGFTRPPVHASGKSRDPDIDAPINFAFRLRYLLGVGTRAETVRYLLTADVESATVADVAASSGYAKRNIQEALTSLQAAGSATSVMTNGEQRFAIDRSRWSYLLGLEADAIPSYRDWPRILGALRRILRWLMRPDLEPLSDYLRTSQAADLLDEIRPELIRAGVSVPARQRGVRSWSDLEDTIEQALAWLRPPNSRGRPAAFEIVDDTLGGHRWRLTADNGRIVATSAEPYKSTRTAQLAVQRLQEARERLSLGVTQDAGAYRWTILAESGRRLGTSNELFTTAQNAERASRHGRALITAAAH